MKRYTVIKNMLPLLHENDILIFSGQEVCKEAYEHHQDNHFYIEDTMGVAISTALGAAMCTDKRVFVFVGEGELLREVGVLPQIGASKCRNMFIVILDNDCYQSSGNHPNVFDGLLSKKGFIYNANMKVSVFTKHFKDRQFKQLNSRFERLSGPAVILMGVDRGFKKNLPDIDINLDEQRDRISKLIMNKERETALFAPPIISTSNLEINALDVDLSKIGGTN